MKSVLTKAIELFVCALMGPCLTGAAYGQASSFTATPTPGDPEVFGLFLRHHDHLMQDIESLRSKDPQAAQLLQQSLAASFRVSASDFVTINTVYRAMKSQFDSLDAEAAAYTKQGTRRDPDFGVLQQFEIRRQKILADGLRKLQTTMLPASWQGLHAYVDGEYRKGVRRTPIGGLPRASGQAPVASPSQVVSSTPSQ
jgi:hypothetical protein